MFLELKFTPGTLLQCLYWKYIIRRDKLQVVPVTATLCRRKSDNSLWVMPRKIIDNPIHPNTRFYFKRAVRCGLFLVKGGETWTFNGSHRFDIIRILSHRGRGEQ